MKFNESVWDLVGWNYKSFLKNIFKVLNKKRSSATSLDGKRDITNVSLLFKFRCEYIVPVFCLFAASVQFSSVTQSCPTLCDPMNCSTPGLPPCPSPTPRVHTNLRPSSRWCHPAISSSVFPFSSCSQSLPASESFPMSLLFAWGGQSTGVSAFASFLPKNTQDWSASEWTGWISLQSKGLSRVFSNTTLQKHQFFGAQLSSQFNSHIHTWPLEKP